MEYVPFSSLIKYLTHCGWLGDAQFALYAAIFGLLAVRAWRRLGWREDGLSRGEIVVSKVVEQMTSACMSMGLLLTFAGLYQYVGAATDQQDRWPLLLALGSSALGYTPMMILQVVGTIDAWNESSSPDGTSVLAAPNVAARNGAVPNGTASNGATSELASRRPSGASQSIMVPAMNWSEFDESQCDDDVDGWRGRVGGALPGAIAAPATGLGSDDEPAVEDERGGDHVGRRAAVDLARRRWDGDLA